MDTAEGVGGSVASGGQGVNGSAPAPSEAVTHGFSPESPQPIEQPTIGEVSHVPETGPEVAERISGPLRSREVGPHEMFARLAEGRLDQDSADVIATEVEVSEGEKSHEEATTSSDTELVEGEIVPLGEEAEESTDDLSQNTQDEEVEVVAALEKEKEIEDLTEALYSDFQRKGISVDRRRLREVVSHNFTRDPFIPQQERGKYQKAQEMTREKYEDEGKDVLDSQMKDKIAQEAMDLYYSKRAEGIVKKLKNKEEFFLSDFYKVMLERAKKSIPRDQLEGLSAEKVDEKIKKEAVKQALMVKDKPWAEITDRLDSLLIELEPEEKKRLSYSTVLAALILLCKHIFKGMQDTLSDESSMSAHRMA